MSVDLATPSRHPAPVLAKLVADAVIEHCARTQESPRALSIRVFGPGFPAKVNGILRGVATDPQKMIHSDTAEQILRAIGKRLTVVDDEQKGPS